MKRSLFILAVVAILLAVINIPVDISAAQGQSDERGQTSRESGSRDRPNNRYIVSMVDLPVASYSGGVQTIPATRPNRGQKIDRDSAAVMAYSGYLNERHDDALKRVGGARKIYDYHYSFNGFTAELTDVQAEVLKTVSGVLSVMKDELQFADTSSTPTFLGLDAPGGLWDRLGGAEAAGEDVIIGVIDSGIWPESRSFSDRIGRKDGRGDNRNGPHFQRGSDDRGGDAADDEDDKDDEGEGDFRFHHLSRWKGTCETGEAFEESDCNRKLIGARRFNAAWGGDVGLKAERPWEFASPRDYNGHGTHTASTAGGNRDVVATGPARVFGRISGMAPRARIAVYKALWSLEDGSQAQGFTSDLVAAIDQAVADGVDVINYSVSGTQTNFLEAVQLSFLFAADAGVFVSASAGNSGPTFFTVAHPAPWVTTVAAGTHNRDGLGSVTLGNSVTYNGSSFATALSSRPLIDAAAAGLPGANPTAGSLCFTADDNAGTPVLDPAKVAGKIVVCDRGTNPRTNKSLAVRDAGGVGMILVNVTPNSVNADLHYVPTVHLAHTERAAVKAYAAGPSPTAVIHQSEIVFNVPAPRTAAFSSRGPLRASGDVLKPDLMAPGQDIVASVAPPGNGGLSFSMYSGTSMSAPHVAGLAALLKQLHEDWTPMMIKSALMTSASDVLDGPNTNATVIVSQGAGHVVPNSAADPGLVFDAELNDWLAFLCGVTTGVNPGTCNGLAAAGYSLDPSDLNGASIAIGELAGVQTVTRTVTNVGRGSATYTPTLTGMAGFSVNVSPSSLRIRPGRSKSFTVTIARTTAMLNAYTGGQLTFTDGRHSVRVPMIVRPTPLAAPAEVFGTGGPLSYNVAFGYTGPFAATGRGLIPAVTTNGCEAPDTGVCSVVDDPNDSFDPAGPGVVAIPVTIFSGTTYARFSLFDANVSPPASDLDLYVYKGTTFLAGSGSGTSAEEVNLLNPLPGGDYVVYVHGFSVPAPGPSTFTLFKWLLGSASAPNMTVTAPTTATTGETGTVNLSFSGLTTGTKYLGSVAYTGITGMPSPTIVRVDP